MASKSTRIDKWLREADAKHARGDYHGARRALEQAHVLGHDRAFVHLAVHLKWLQLAVSARNPGMAMGQVLPILFAVPVSLVQRYAGLALPGRKRLQS
jgi:hypothetical protein